MFRAEFDAEPAPAGNTSTGYASTGKTSAGNTSTGNTSAGPGGVACRWGVLLLALGLVLTALAGCTSRPGPGTASRAPTGSPAASTPDGTGGLGVGSPPPTQAGTGSPQPPTYPKDARAYAEAAITAWVNGQTARLAQLTTAGAAVTFANIPGRPDPHWQYYRCEGTAGGPYCIFRNSDGDELTLRLINQYLGQPHAVGEVMFDRTE